MTATPLGHGGPWRRCCCASCADGGSSTRRGSVASRGWRRCTSPCTRRRPASGPDQNRLQGRLAAAILTWDEWVLDAAGARDQDVVDQLAGVPEAYKSDVDPVQALADLRVIRSLGKEPELRLSVEPGPLDVEMKLRFFLDGRGVTLSAVLPVLHSLGVEVLDERPYEFVRPDGSRCWLYTFGLRVDEATSAEIRTRPIALSQELFCAAFAAAWRGEAESDGFSALVLRTGLAWREVAVLRAYARYARQLGNPYGVKYMADTLLAHPAVASALLGLFTARFDPALRGAARGRGRRAGHRPGVDRRGDRVGRRPDPAQFPGDDRRDAAHELLSGAAVPVVQDRPVGGAGHARSAAPVRDLRLFAAGGGGASALRAGRPRRSALE